MYTRVLTVTVVALLLTTLPAVADSTFLLIRRDLQVQTGSLKSLDRQHLVFTDAQGQQQEPVEQYIALANTEVTPELPSVGLVQLADGQRLPGSPEQAQDEDVLAWRHPWLGTIPIPLEDVAHVRFVDNAPLPAEGDGDVILLRNGDLLEGFLVSLGDPVVLEVDDGDEPRLLELPRDSVASARLVTPTRQSDHTRIWLADASVLDVRDITLEQSGRVRLKTLWHDDDQPPARLRMIEVAAILLDANRLRALADLEPQHIEGPVTRYETPPPRVLEDGAVLNLSPIAYSGPIIVRYALPARAQRFAAEASLPEGARTWGDVELIVRDDSEEVFRTPLNADSPTASINVELTGSELTIELKAARYGPVQDMVVLEQPMLLLDGADSLAE